MCKINLKPLHYNKEEKYTEINNYNQMLVTTYIKQALNYLKQIPQNIFHDFANQLKAI